MGALLGLAGAVLIGHIALGTAVGALTVPAWIELGGGVVSVIKLDAQLLKVLAAKRPGKIGNRPIAVAAGGSPAHLCFKGAPSAQAARLCP
jgi:hypothetical protein